MVGSKIEDLRNDIIQYGWDRTAGTSKDKVQNSFRMTDFERGPATHPTSPPAIHPPPLKISIFRYFYLYLHFHSYIVYTLGLFYLA